MVANSEGGRVLRNTKSAVHVTSDQVAELDRWHVQTGLSLKLRSGFGVAWHCGVAVEPTVLLAQTLQGCVLVHQSFNINSAKILNISQSIILHVNVLPLRTDFSEFLRDTSMKNRMGPYFRTG